MLISDVLYARCLLAPAADSGLCAFSGIIGCSSPKLRKSPSQVAKLNTFTMSFMAAVKRANSWFDGGVFM
jgi:hypothetical protein